MASWSGKRPVLEAPAELLATTRTAGPSRAAAALRKCQVKSASVNCVDTEGRTFAQNVSSSGSIVDSSATVGVFLFEPAFFANAKLKAVRSSRVALGVVRDTWSVQIAQPTCVGSA